MSIKKSKELKAIEKEVKNRLFPKFTKEEKAKANAMKLGITLKHLRADELTIYFNANKERLLTDLEETDYRDIQTIVRNYESKAVHLKSETIQWQTVDRQHHAIDKLKHQLSEARKQPIEIIEKKLSIDEKVINALNEYAYFNILPIDETYDIIIERYGDIETISIEQKAYNHGLIINAIDGYLGDYYSYPTNHYIARRTNLSIKYVAEHLEQTNDTKRTNTMLNVMRERVLIDIYNESKGADGLKAAKIFLDTTSKILDKQKAVVTNNVAFVNQAPSEQAPPQLEEQQQPKEILQLKAVRNG